jgi:hypothetical protein
MSVAVSLHALTAIDRRKTGIKTVGFMILLSITSAADGKNRSKG